MKTLTCELDQVMEKVCLGMAKALFISCWADECERIAEETKVRPPWPMGARIDDYAPELPTLAFIEAGRLLGKIERTNDADIYMLCVRSMKADMAPDMDYERFGWYLAMQAMGHGVSWFDDHEKFEIKIPSFEFRGQFSEENS